jgi:hypothetical protein
MRTPTSTLAPSAFVELGLAKSLFERTVSNPTAGQALVGLLVMLSYFFLQFHIHGITFSVTHYEIV